MNSPGAVAERTAGASVVDGLNLGDHRQGDLLGCIGADVEPDGAVGTGVFGAMMAVKLINDGPVTIWMEREPGS